jgi:LuxR family maltose regulon positive regulatory protein
MLERVERANLFLVPLDEVRGWWRYHHLFADLLRARLQQQQPGLVTELHSNAAAWCEERGLADDAVRHALAAGDTTWAARLIERHFDETFWPGERATVQRWLSALPAELARLPAAAVPGAGNPRARGWRRRRGRAAAGCRRARVRRCRG